MLNLKTHITELYFEIIACIDSIVNELFCISLYMNNGCYTHLFYSKELAMHLRYVYIIFNIFK